MVNRVFREWLSLRRLRELPSINDLNPQNFAVDWDWSYIASSGEKVEGGGCPVPIFEFVGKNFEHQSADFETGALYTAVPKGSFLAYATIPIIRLVLKEKIPIISEGTDSWGEDGILKMRAIGLPFINRLGAVSYVLGSFSGKVTHQKVPDFPEGLRIFRFVDGRWVAKPVPDDEIG
jgi:hypothetical protein